MDTQGPPPLGGQAWTFGWPPPPLLVHVVVEWPPICLPGWLAWQYHLVHWYMSCWRRQLTTLHNKMGCFLFWNIDFYCYHSNSPQSFVQGVLILTLKFHRQTIFGYKKNIKKLKRYYAFFLCGRYNILKKLRFFFAHENTIKTALKRGKLMAIFFLCNPECPKQPRIENSY